MKESDCLPSTQGRDMTGPHLQGPHNPVTHPAIQSSDLPAVISHITRSAFGKAALGKNTLSPPFI